MGHKYKIFFHQGPEIGLKTHVSRGVAWIDASVLNIQGRDGGPIIQVAGIEEVEMFRLHGLARVVRVDHRDGRLFLAVVRFMIGQFASVNFFGTGELHSALANIAKPIESRRIDPG